MAPHIGRIAFKLGMTVLFLALIPLPFLEPGSPEFVVDIIAIGATALFLAAISWEVRREARITLERRGDDVETEKERKEAEEES